MPTSRCILCGQPTDETAVSGLCETCRGASDETRRLDPEAGTRSHDAPEAGTQPYGAETGFGVLPPGGYRYEEQIGSGGMGVVWRAVRVSTNQVVAIKKLKPECFTHALLRRFVAEARTLAAVDHPNVVRLQDFVPDPADPFLVLEFVPGESLAHHLRAAGPLHPDRAARLIGEAAKGVEAAHAVGVIHRDLKPGNLLLTPDGRVKVVDFGLSKQLAEVEAEVMVATGGGPPPPSESLTGVGRLAGGTPGFMAPEQVDESFGAVGPPTDVWGLGACLHTLLIGRPPFPPGKENLERVTTDPLVPPHELNPAIPTDLSAIVVRCLAKRPADRYPTPTALAADLDRYAKGDSTTARPHPWLTRAWRRIRRTPKVAAMAVVVAVLAVAVGGALAMVPKWLEETPESIQEGYRRDLRAGRTATLVGETGLPRYHEWWVGNPGWDPERAARGECGFESVGHALLVLLTDPGVDHYVVRAEVQQIESRLLPAGGVPADEGGVGLCVGLARAADAPDAWGVCGFCLRFTDFDSGFQKTGVLKDQQARSESVALYPDRNRVVTRRHSAHNRTDFRPQTTRPGLWRGVEYEVNGNALIPRWRGEDGWRPLVTKRPAVDAAAMYQSAPAIARLEWPAFPAVEWRPRSAVGIYCHSSSVAIRNITITPLP
jgi:serine/threonine protein kinase